MGLNLVYFFFYDSISLAMDFDSSKKTVYAVDWGEAGLFLGVCTYAYESIGSIFNGKRATLIASPQNHEE